MPGWALLLIGAAIVGLVTFLMLLHAQVLNTKRLLEAHLDLHDRDERFLQSELEGRRSL